MLKNILKNKKFTHSIELLEDIKSKEADSLKQDEEDMHHLEEAM